MRDKTSRWVLRYRRFRSRVHALRSYFAKPKAANRIVKRTDFTRCEKPVLLIYGFMATRRSFEVMERRLRRDGYCVFSLNLGGMKGAFNNRSIDELAQLVSEKVEKLYARYNLGPLTIIGHSKGGLIGTHYVKHLGGHKRVRTLITIGTPHNGTPLAFLGLLILPIAKSVLQMMPMSPFILRLRRTPVPDSVFMASLWSKQDRTCPHPGAVLRNEAPNVVNVEVEAAHFDLLLRKRVYDVVHAQLLAGEAWSAKAAVVRLRPAQEDERAATLVNANGTMGLPV